MIELQGFLKIFLENDNFLTISAGKTHGPLLDFAKGL
jgi:hypothetical protein